MIRTTIAPIMMLLQCLVLLFANSLNIECLLQRITRMDVLRQTHFTEFIIWNFIWDLVFIGHENVYDMVYS